MIGKTVRLKDSVAEDDFNKRGIEPCHLKSMKNTQLKVLGILEPIQQNGRTFLLTDYAVHWFPADWLEIVEDDKGGSERNAQQVDLESRQRVGKRKR